MISRFRTSVVSSLIVISTLIGPGGALAASNYDLQAAINDTTMYDPNDYSTCTNAGSVAAGTTPTGTDNLQKAFNYLSAQLNKRGDKQPSMEAAAIIGNMEQESGQGLNPNALNPASGAYGIAQWLGGRLTALKALPNYTTIDTQLVYLWTQDIPSQVAFHPLETIAKDTTIEQMTFDWENTFERAGETLGSAPMNNRINNAKAVLKQFGNTPGTGAGTTSPTCGGVSLGDCKPSAPATSGLSTTRQSILSLANCELALWKSKPGYPNPAYAATGLLKYSNGWYEEWCADFASWVYHNAGDSFTGGRNGWDVSGVSSIAAQTGKFTFHPESQGYQPHPGDLAIHGSSHVNVYMGTSAGTSEYIGGDQGSPPYGAPEPTQTPPSPPSGSIVSTELEKGYYGGDITGYLSPN
jgi:Phage tail lysozyme